MEDDSARGAPGEPSKGWLTSREAARLLRLTPGTLDSYRCKGRGPRFFKQGNAVRYRLADVEAYLSGEGAGDGD
ncbi:MAG: helix-turn-helix domain-containing protein [Planctomycetota bacterium]|jgi:hypothetical protein